MNENILIPKLLNIGFQERDDTYTGKLAYIIYYDEKNVLRKEKSWNNWRDKEITNIEVENKPISGFVLNKKVGKDIVYTVNVTETNVKKPNKNNSGLLVGITCLSVLFKGAKVAKLKEDLENYNYHKVFKVMDTDEISKDIIKYYKRDTIPYALDRIYESKINGE